MEILFVEIGGRNKNIPSLICVAYQPGSNEIGKLEWLRNFENILAGVYLKWKTFSSLLMIFILIYSVSRWS